MYTLYNIIIICYISILLLRSYSYTQYISWKLRMEDITTVDTLTVSVPANIVNQVINDSALRQLQDQTGLTANAAQLKQKTDGDNGTRH